MVALKDKDLVSILLSSSKDTNLKPLLTAAWMREMMASKRRTKPVKPVPKIKRKRKKPAAPKINTKFNVNSYGTNSGTNSGNTTYGTKSGNSGNSGTNSGNATYGTNSGNRNINNRNSSNRFSNAFANTNTNPRPQYLAKRMNDSLTRFGERLKGTKTPANNRPFNNRGNRDDPLGPLMREIENNSRRVRSNY